jgi:hypothetical protein
LRVGGDVIEPFPDRLNASKIVILIELLVAPFQLG